MPGVCARGMCPGYVPGGVSGGVPGGSARWSVPGGCSTRKHNKPRLGTLRWALPTGTSVECPVECAQSKCPVDCAWWSASPTSANVIPASGIFISHVRNLAPPKRPTVPRGQRSQECNMSPWAWGPKKLKTTHGVPGLPQDRAGTPWDPQEIHGTSIKRN